MKKGAMSDFKQRFVMSVICIILLVVFIGLAPYNYFKPIFTLIVATVCSVALWEYFQIAKAKGVQPLVKGGIIGTYAYVFSVLIATQWSVLNFLPLVILGLLLAFLFLNHFDNAENSLVSLAVTYFGIMYIVVTLSGLVKITYFFSDNPSEGRFWLIYLLVVTKMTDIGGLFIGRFFGKRPLLVQVSPNKTVEGAFGGVLFATIASVLFASIADFGLSIYQAIALGIALSIFAEIGDLAESLLKRDGKIKDSNQHLPGLGGILDMVDSLIFTTPVLYLFLRMTTSGL